MNVYKIKIPYEASIEEKKAEVLAAIDSYKNAQKFQLENGGPGPVADYEIMAIVNHYESRFEIYKEFNPASDEYVDPQ